MVRSHRFVPLALTVLLAAPAARAQELPVENEAGPQTPAPADGAAEAPGPAKMTFYRPKSEYEASLMDRYGNFHVAVVGEEIITRVDLLAWMEGPRFDDPTEGVEGMSPRDRLSQQATAALTQLIEQRLKIQGGRAQGYEPELIANERERQFRRGVERLGGEQNAAAQFERMGITPEEYKELMGEGLMANLWESSVTGLQPGSTGRVFVDRYVRPGRMHARYLEYRRSRRQEDNEIVGLNREGSVDLQQITLLVQPGGKPASEIELQAKTTRERIESGFFTFEEALRNLVDPRFQGENSIVRDAPLGPLTAALTKDSPTQAAAIETFVNTAPVDGLSPVLMIERGGQPAAYVIQRVMARREASEATPFRNLELQKKLELKIQEEAREVRVSRGLAELIRTTHLSPQDIRKDFLENHRRYRRKN